MFIVPIDEIPLIWILWSPILKAFIISKVFVILLVEILLGEFLFLVAWLQITVKKGMKGHLGERVIIVPFIPLCLRASIYTAFVHV